jgi:predicted transcriptional regulator
MQTVKMMKEIDFPAPFGPRMAMLAPFSTLKLMLSSKQLTKEDLLEPGSERADYRLTPKAVIKMHEDTRTPENYTTGVRRDLKFRMRMTSNSNTTSYGRTKVGLIMKEGVMLTVPPDRSLDQAKGIALSDSNANEDLGL